jgi:hypothetical protein
LFLRCMKDCLEAFLDLVGGDREADGGKMEEGAVCCNFGDRFGCLLDPRKLQLESPFPYMAQGLGGAGWRPLPVGLRI